MKKEEKCIFGESHDEGTSANQNVFICVLKKEYMRKRDGSIYTNDSFLNKLSFYKAQNFRLS